MDIYIMFRESVNGRIYQCIYKGNYMCLCSAGSLEELCQSIRKMYVRAKGDIAEYVADAKIDSDYSFNPPAVLANCRKAMQNYFENLFIGALTDTIRAAENDLVAAQKSNKTKILPKLKKSPRTAKKSDNNTVAASSTDTVKKKTLRKIRRDKSTIPTKRPFTKRVKAKTV